MNAVLIKLDENLGQRGRRQFIDAGHEVATVLSQGLAGAADRELIAICRAEQRCLVTLDLDFANPLVFPPDEYAGIAVLRLPPRATPTYLEQAASTLIAGLAREPINGKLWIVERSRIRHYLGTQEE